MRRLISVGVENLLGRFDHEVRIDEDWEFVILHGPNGVGKTRFLEVIANTFRLRTRALLDIPFSRAKFRFSDGTVLSVVKVFQDPAQLQLTGEESEFSETDPSEAQAVTYNLGGFGSEHVEWTTRRRDLMLNSRRIRDLERFLPIDRIDTDLWADRRVGDYLSLEEVTERYSEDLPHETDKREVPQALREFLSGSPVHLIETQRLLSYAQLSAPRPSAHRTRVPERATVSKFADDLTSRIADTLARNSRTSQELDRTFPRRVLSQDIPDSISDEQIKNRYEAQSNLRRSLAEIAVLDSSAELPLPEKTLEGWERLVLWTYLEDSEKKLATFQTLLDRVRLLREIVNSRFLFKELLIDSEKGFRFVTDQDKEVSPTKLSSGEQHQLVLLYDLLFNVEANSIVLVDEPEISLHVGWQQEFLNDIQQIAALADLQFVVATHSPQIIHTWWERAVALYRIPPDDNPK